MHISEETCRNAAAYCLELAKSTTNDNARLTLLAMAQTWLDLAYSAGPRSLAAALSIFEDDQMSKH